MDLPVPEFGGVVGLSRFAGAAVEGIRQMDIPEAKKPERIGGQLRY